MNLMNEIKKDEIIEIQLSGEKLVTPTNNLEQINKIGSNLYEQNRQFIKEKVPDNWFAAIEPVSGKLFAWSDELELYLYLQKLYPDSRLFYSVGLIKERMASYANT